jgi:hypothetical protein
MSDEFDSIAIPDNILERIRELEDQVRTLQIRDTQAETLGEITPDMGEIRSGAFICGEGDPYSEGDPFTGCAMAYPPITMPNGDLANILGANAGSPEFWLSALDGTAVFAGGAARLDRNGGQVTGLQTAWRLEAENGGQTRRAHLGMYLPDGQTTPALGLILTDPDTGAELVLNPGFESDLSDWAQQFAGTINVVTDVYHSGSKSLCYTHNSVAKEIYSAARIAVTSGTKYLAQAWIYQEYGFIKAVGEIRWYNAATSGTLLRTDTFMAQQAATGAWKQFEMAFTAPAGATHAETVVRFEPVFGSGAGTRAWVDDISLAEASVYAGLTFEPDCTLRGSSLRIASLASRPAVDSMPLVHAYQGKLYHQRPGLPYAQPLEGFRVRERMQSAYAASKRYTQGMEPVNTDAATTWGNYPDIDTAGTTRFGEWKTNATTGSKAGITTSTNTTVYPKWSPSFFARIKTGASISNMRFFCGLHSVEPSANPAPGYWATFKYDSAFGAIVGQSNIATFEDTISIVAPSTNTEYILEIYVDYPARKIYYVVNETVYVSNPLGTWANIGLNPYAYIQTTNNTAKSLFLSRMVWECD